MPTETKVIIKTGGSVFESGRLWAEDDWRTKYHDWPTNPDTSQPWTWAEINALQAGVKLTGVVDEEEEALSADCSQLYVEVTYTPAGIKRPLVGGSLVGNSLVGKGLA